MSKRRIDLLAHSAPDAAVMAIDLRCAAVLSSRVARGRSDPTVKPTIEAYTVALPWYDRADFQRLWELAHDHDEMPDDYDVWYASALSVMNAWLARGRALQIVTIKPDEFLAWLEARTLPNTAATRLRYVEEKASGAGSETGGIGIAACSSAMSNSSSRAS